MRRLTECIGPAFYPVYEDIMRAGHTHYWLPGGRGSLKSSFCGIVIPLGMMQDKTGLANAVVYRKIYNEIEGSVFEQILWGIDMLGVSEQWRWTKKPMMIEYILTGQRIVFRGADDPRKSKSIKFRRGYAKYVWFEELAEFGGMEEIRTILQSLIRGGDDAVVLYSYNPPKSAQSWVNAEEMIPRPSRMVCKTTYLQAPAKWLGARFVAEAEELKRTNELAYRHEYLGEVTGTGGQVFDNLEIRRIYDDEIESMDKPYIGLDFGFAVDPDACVKWHWDKRNRKIYAMAEYYGSHTPDSVLADKVSAIAGDHVVICDSAEPRTIANLRREGLRVVAAKKGPDSVRHGMRWLQELNKIVIDPARTPNIAREFAGYEYRMDKHGNFLPDYPDRDNHTIDATRYALEYIATANVVKTINRASLGL